MKRANLLPLFALSTLLLGLALTESCAIYGFVTALIIAFTLA